MTLIFDEVDAGVSGHAAQKVAEKLASVAEHKQVLCVTHLAADCSHGGLPICYISKAVKNGPDLHLCRRLWTLRAESREIARIIGGAVITETTLKKRRGNAKTLTIGNDL